MNNFNFSFNKFCTGDSFGEITNIRWKTFWSMEMLWGTFSSWFYNSVIVNSNNCLTLFLPLQIFWAAQPDLLQLDQQIWLRLDLQTKAASNNRKWRYMREKYNLKGCFWNHCDDRKVNDDDGQKSAIGKGDTWKRLCFYLISLTKMSFYIYRVVFFVSSDRSSYSDGGLLYIWREFIKVPWDVRGILKMW